MFCFEDTLSNIFPLAVFVPCNSHIINLVASDFKKHFVELNEFMKCFRNLFYVPSGRLLNFLESRTGKKAGMPPNPTTKSWSAWFNSAIYYKEFFLVLSDFIKQEVARGCSTTSNSLLSMEEMYFSQEHVKDEAPTLLSCLNYFQERMPRLVYYLEGNASAKEDFSLCFEDSPYGICNWLCKVRLQSSLRETVEVHCRRSTASHAIFQAGESSGSRNIGDCNHNFDSINSNPGIETVSRRQALKLSRIWIMVR